MLGHYGVTDLDRTPELEAAVFRIFLAQQRMSADVAVVSELLRQWLAGTPAAGVAAASAPGSPWSTWSRPPRCASRRCPTWPAAWCSAGSPSRCCAATAPRSTPRCATTCATWTANPDAPDRAERIQTMVASAEPLVRLIGQRIGRPGRDHAPLLEVLTRRYYGNRGLSEVDRARRGRLPVRHRRAHRLGQRHPGGHHRRRHRRPARRHRRGRQLAAGVAERGLVADLYVTWEDQPDADAMAVRLGELLAAHPLPAGVRRITTTVAGTSGAVMHHHFTFRPDGAGASPRTG